MDKNLDDVVGAVIEEPLHRGLVNVVDLLEEEDLIESIEEKLQDGLEDYTSEDKLPFIEELQRARGYNMMRYPD